MLTVELWFGRYDSEWTIFHVLSGALGIEPKVYTIDDFSAFIQNNGGYWINIHNRDMPYGNAAKTLAEVLLLFEQLKQDKGKEYLDYVFIPREKVTLDFTECKTTAAIYAEMRKKMEWDERYGENLNALWDILTGLPYKGDDFLILRPKQYRNIPYGYDMEFTLEVDEICNIFLKAQEIEEIDVMICYSESQR